MFYTESGCASSSHTHPSYCPDLNVNPSGTHIRSLADITGARQTTYQHDQGINWNFVAVANNFNG